MSSFLSRFSSKSKASKSKAPPPISTALAPTASLLHLKLPSPSLLIYSTPQLGVDRSPSAQSADSSPWVKVDEGDGKEREVEDVRAETRKMGKARLGVGEVTELMQECGGVVRERGSTTLGIFRPYRFAESPSLIRKLSLLFLAYAQDFSPASNSAPTDLWSKNTKAAKLERFREELKYAGVHDVVGVLKWGLRHLSFSTSFAGTPSLSSSAPLAWYTTFLSSSSTQSHPKTAFTTLLLPTLPPSSRSLLLSSLSLLQSVSAHTETNAMAPRKLARMLGLYVFGLADSSRVWRSWEEVYEVWREAGEAMEGCFKAFLREQEDLPRRLEEIVEGYSGRERKVGVVRVELESQGEWRSGVNDQRTGLKGGEGNKVARRDPLEILRAAFEASEKILDDDDEMDEAKMAWKVVVRSEKEGRDPQVVLSHEVVRVLGLVSLDSLPPKPSTPTRRRSLSYGRSDLAPLSEEPRRPTGDSPNSLSNFPNKSVGNLLAPKTRNVTPSWSDFASAGFGEKAPFESNEFGLVAPRQESNVKRSQTVGAAGGRTKPVEQAPRAREPLTRIVRISTMEIDEEFMDVYLDTLVDPISSSWPSFILSELSPSILSSLHSPISHLLITQLLIPFNTLARSPSALSTRSASIAESTASRSGWNRRMSGLFGGSLRGKKGMESRESLVTFAGPTAGRKGRKEVAPPVPELKKMEEETREEGKIEGGPTSSAQKEIGEPVVQPTPVVVEESEVATGTVAVGTVSSNHETEPSTSTGSTVVDEVKVDSATLEVESTEVRMAESFELVDTVEQLAREPVLVEEVVVEEPVVIERVEVEEPVVVAPLEVEEPVVVEAAVDEVVQPVVVEETFVEEAVIEEVEIAVEEAIVEETDAAVEKLTLQDSEALITPVPEVREPISAAPIVEDGPVVASPIVQEPRLAVAEVNVEESQPVAEEVDVQPESPSLVEISFLVASAEVLEETAPAPVEAEGVVVPAIKGAAPVEAAEEVVAVEESTPTPISIDTSALLSSHAPTPSTPLPSSPLPTSPKLAAGSPLSESLSATSATSLPSPTSSSKKFFGSKAIGGLLRRRKSSLAEKEKLKEKKREEKELRKAAPLPVVVPTPKVEPKPVSSVKKRVLEIEAARLEAEERLREREREMKEVPSRRMSVVPRAVEQVDVVETKVEEPVALAVEEPALIVEEPEEPVAVLEAEPAVALAEETAQVDFPAIDEIESLVVPTTEDSAHSSPSLEDEAFEDAPLTDSALFTPHPAGFLPSSIDTPSSPVETVGPSSPLVVPTEPSSFVEPSTPTQLPRELPESTPRKSGEVLRSFASQHSLAETARSFETAVSNESGEVRAE